MKKVFISYSWKDEAIALRLYRDLKQANINIWLDRIDGEPTGDFKQEFLRLINACDCFIVIDSGNYRHKSNWCETELRAYFNRVDAHQNVSMIVCLAEKPGEWRAVESIQDISKHSLYERLNAQKYFVLSHDGVYDNERAYYIAVESIQHILGKDSYSWAMFPEEADIIDELGVELKTHPEICDDDRESLKTFIRSIVLRRNQHRDITKHLKQLIDDCKELDLDIFIPYWMYALWLADDRHDGKHDQDCFETLKQLSVRYPKESRVYRALGSMAARLKQKEFAANCFMKALELIDASQKTIRYEVCINLGQVYMNLRQHANARKYFEEALSLVDIEADEITSFLVVSYYECLIHLSDEASAGKFIERMAAKYHSSAEIQCSCGFHYLNYGQVPGALVCFERAYSLNPSLENAYGYLCALLRIGNIQEYRTLLSTALSQTPATTNEAIWKDAIKELPRK